MKEVKKKHSVWLSESAWADVEHHYQADNCSTKNEYIEKAIQFYSGYLDTEHAEEYLPRILSDVLEGKLGAFGKRMGHLLFKQAVDQDLMANLFASDINVGLDTLQKLRVRCVKNVKETNGEIDFQDAFRFQSREVAADTMLSTSPLGRVWSSWMLNIPPMRAADTWSTWPSVPALTGCSPQTVLLIWSKPWRRSTHTPVRYGPSSTL